MNPVNTIKLDIPAAAAKTITNAPAPQDPTKAPAPTARDLNIH
jgi:hypothetical protein